MNKKTIIIIAIVAIIAVIAVIFLAKRLTGKDDSANQQTTTPNQNGSVPNPNFPLSEDAHTAKEEVKHVQAWLNSNYKVGLDVDGYWGEKTTSAVKSALGVSEISQSLYESKGMDKSLI